MSSPTPSPLPPPGHRLWVARWLIPAGLLVAAVAAVVVVAVAGYSLLPSEATPEDAWHEITLAAQTGDTGAIWDHFDTASQERMATRLREFAKKEAPLGADRMTDRERFIILLDRRPKLLEYYLPGPVARVTRDGDRATVYLDRPDPTRGGREQTVHMVRVEGRWYLAYGASSGSERP